MRDLGLFFPDPLWFAERRGKLTSSKIKDATKKRKRGDGELAARRNLKFQMLAEMSTDRTVDHYVSLAMDWGIRMEPVARQEYELRIGGDISQVGLVIHPENDRFAATPDGWIRPNGLLEIKCPNTETHFEYLANGIVPEEYIDQIDWQMACAGPEIEFVDFVSFDPRVEAEELQMFTVRVERNNERIAEKEALGEEFLSEVITLFEQIRRNAKPMTIEDKLRESIKQSRGKYTDSEMMDMLRDEGISVP